MRRWNAHVTYGIIIGILTIGIVASIVIIARQHVNLSICASNRLDCDARQRKEGSQEQRSPPPTQRQDAAANGIVRVVVDRNNNLDTPPVTFGQIGYIVHNEDGKRMPLYGQPSYTRRGRYNYYTIDASGIKLPILSSNRDCMDEVGCDEVYDGDQVGVDGDESSSWNVRLYKPVLPPNVRNLLYTM